MNGYLKGLYVGEMAFAFKGHSIESVCAQCPNIFKHFKSQPRKFCSRPCFRNSRRLDTSTKCKQCDKSIPNRKPNGAYFKRTFCNRKCSQVYSGKHRTSTRYWLGKQRLDMRGSNNVNWRPNPKTDESKLARHQVVYKEWRKAVFERDNYTCQSCKQRGGNLHPDHVMPFAFFPDLRFEVLNGRTLCVPCHKKTDTYGSSAAKSPLVLSSF